MFHSTRKTQKRQNTLLSPLRTNTGLSTRKTQKRQKTLLSPLRTNTGLDAGLDAGLDTCYLYDKIKFVHVNLMSGGKVIVNIPANGQVQQVTQMQSGVQPIIEPFTSQSQNPFDIVPNYSNATAAYWTQENEPSNSLLDQDEDKENEPVEWASQPKRPRIESEINLNQSTDYDHFLDIIRSSIS